MSGYDIAALAILILLCVIALGVIYFLASWPGRIAYERDHPHAAAVQIGGWATLLFGGVFWPLVLMWAYISGGEGDVQAKVSKGPELEDPAPGQTKAGEA
jgi:hypothetical protein